MGLVSGGMEVEYFNMRCPMDVLWMAQNIVKTLNTTYLLVNRQERFYEVTSQLY